MQPAIKNVNTLHMLGGVSHHTARVSGGGMEAGAHQLVCRLSRGSEIVGESAASRTFVE